jgi:hypothetical protein
MGMYAHGPYVEDMKMSGLLATCVIEATKVYDEPFEGVEVVDDLLAGGVVSLTREEVRCVVTLMREKLLDGHAGSCNGWAKSINRSDKSYGEEPLLNLQDIYRFETDVRNFSALCTWLNHTENEEIYWA